MFGAVQSYGINIIWWFVISIRVVALIVDWRERVREILELVRATSSFMINRRFTGFLHALGGCFTTHSTRIRCGIEFSRKNLIYTIAISRTTTINDKKVLPLIYRHHFVEKRREVWGALVASKKTRQIRTAERSERASPNSSQTTYPHRVTSVSLK